MPEHDNETIPVVSYYDDAVTVLDGWLGEPVVVTMLPEGTVLRGRLSPLDSAGIDGTLYALAEGDGAPSGVALALFRDGVVDARREEDQVVVRQGHMTLTVAREPRL